MAITPQGAPLTASDFESLAARWIDSTTAQAQLLRRVASLEGAAIIGRNGSSADCAGIVIPNIWPGTDYIREYRLRRDHPEMENGKARGKYLSPSGRGNLLWFAVGTDPALLADARLPLVITEGEFKTIALDRAARHAVATPRFLAAGLSGVWNWRGSIGKTIDLDGNRVDVKGPIGDLAHIAFDERPVLVIFDADLADNESVQAARALLTKELRSRAALVSWFRWPENRPQHAKGIDDLLAALGPEPVLALIESAFERAAGPPDLTPFLHTDTGNADRLVTLYGADLRYCFSFRKWLRWDGRRWSVDETAQALKMAKRTMTTFLNQAIGDDNREKFAKSSLDARRLQSMLTLAQPELPIMPGELDCADHLLNFQNGTVDLRTGNLRRHRRSDFLSKLVHYNFNPTAECPSWLTFLNQIMGATADASEGELHRADELIRYLQLALGYSLTASTSERAIFVCYGSGANGKTTLLSVVRDLVLEYAATVGLDLLTTKDESSNVAAARAKLLGARLVSTSETEESQRLSAARLKRICQGPGGEIEACRKYENPITFRETGKLWLDANHRPELPASDVALWSRVHLIPFTVTIPKDAQDGQLREKLLAEAEGILAWLVAGAVRWYAEGLPESEIVMAATEEWRASLDRVKDFLEERTVAELGKWIPNKNLYASYRGWCEEHSERPLPERRFGLHLTGMGLKRDKKNVGVVWHDLRFRSSE